MQKPPKRRAIHSKTHHSGGNLAPTTPPPRHPPSKSTTHPTIGMQRATNSRTAPAACSLLAAAALLLFAMQADARHLKQVRALAGCAQTPAIVPHAHVTRLGCKSGLKTLCAMLRRSPRMPQPLLAAFTLWRLTPVSWQQQPLQAACSWEASPAGGHWPNPAGTVMGATLRPTPCPPTSLARRCRCQPHGNLWHRGDGPLVHSKPEHWSEDPSARWVMEVTHRGHGAPM